MDHGKVMKSKSSNTAISSKSPVKSSVRASVRTSGRNKKSWSSAEFQASNSKKRGVYVEKKSTNVFNTQHALEECPKPQRSSRRNRRNDKPFLKSVLNILSQDTAATQCPDASDMLRPGKPRKVRRRINVETEDKCTQDLDAIYSNNNSPKRSPSPPVKTVKKPKYRSKVLNNNLDDRFVILQPKRDLTHTPSNYSEPVKVLESTVKWSDFKGLEAEAESKAEEKDEVKKLKKAKVLRIEEPSTLVSQYKQKNNKSLYNFFVDLLETTFSVYNIHAEYDEAKKSNTNLEIDEQIVKKLNLPQKRDKSPKFTDSNFKQSSIFAIRDDDDVAVEKVEVYKVPPKYSNMNPPILKNSKNRRSKYRNSVRSASFTYSDVYRSLSPQTVSVVPKTSSIKKNKKQTLLNILKEELRMDEDEFEEPQTMHEALKIIAKNKRRCRRTIHFDDTPRVRTGSPGDPECMFKRRKVISSSTHSTKRNKKFRIYNPQSQFMSTIKTSFLPRQFSATTYTTGVSRRKTDYSSVDSVEGSIHSLEVTAYDYEPNAVVRKRDTKTKAILYATHSKESLKTESIESSKNFEGPNMISSNSSLSTSISQLLMKDTIDIF